MQDVQAVRDAAAWIKARLPAGFSPCAALVLGTGLGGSLETLETLVSIPYPGIPGFGQATAPGHDGRLAAGRLSGRDVLLWEGRLHLYEGRSPGEVCRSVRVSALLGVRALLVTNAAGSLNPLHETGGLLAITDHVNLTGKTPLSGPNEDAFGPRFPDMSRAYSRRMLDVAARCALDLGLRLEMGVYAGVHGPQMETPAETRMLRMLGADAVGMSTVMEVLAARHMGLEVLGLSCLVNQNLPDCMAEVTVEEVLAAAAEAGKKLGPLLEAVVARL